MQIYKTINGKITVAPHHHRWKAMHARCYDQKHKHFYNYGGRGIYVCSEWHDFETFFKWCKKGYKPGLSVDRIDNDGPYAPWNCKWSTRSEQQLNSRQYTPKKLAFYKRWALASQKGRHLKFGDPTKRTEKICGTCKKLLPIVMFYKHKTKPDGRQGACKRCNAAALMAARQKAKDKNVARR